ncbi:hypothetical protein CMEL01_01950 [Colletotrichum melonis]|uniref:Uncharacterized protein n=1 Tax=Colletotrichum melonis TaxID=1209925 RepID=A0AAI9XQC1_9PEZI|nr:hypothetical protein CMEL01_01950 [Colletotrichum melonis]
MEYHSLCQLSYAACVAVLRCLYIVIEPCLAYTIARFFPLPINTLPNTRSTKHTEIPQRDQMIFSPQFESMFRKIPHVGREAGVRWQIGMSW